MYTVILYLKIAYVLYEYLGMQILYEQLTLTYYFSDSVLVLIYYFFCFIKFFIYVILFGGKSSILKALVLP